LDRTGGKMVGGVQKATTAGELGPIRFNGRGQQLTGLKAGVVK